MRTIPLDEEDGRKVFQVEASWSEIEPDYQDLVARYRRIRLWGFRPGKAPKRVIEQRFRREIVSDLSERVAVRISREALEEAGIETLGSAEAFEIECNPGKPFHTKVRYFLMPDFDLPDLVDLKTDDDGTDFRDRISRRLLELVAFEVPGDLVRQELEISGLGESEPFSEEWHSAEERIMLMIILKKIARHEGIEVEEGEVNKRITEKAEEFGTTEGALRKELEQGGGMARLRDLLLAESTLEYIKHHVSEGV